MNVRPLHDRIIVRRIEEGEQKIGGIIIPDSAKEKPQQGKVLAVGNGRTNDEGTRIPLDVKPGNLILFGKYSGQEIKLDGEEYLIMREDEVLGVIEGSSNGKTKDDGKRTPLDVKAGDLILFGKYSGQEIKLDGEEYLIMREDEVLAVIEDKKKK